MPRRARTTTAPAILGKYFWLGGAVGVGEGLMPNWAAPVSVGEGLAEAEGLGEPAAAGPVAAPVTMILPVMPSEA